MEKQIENKSLRFLLAVHGLLTLLASIVLITAPDVIPKMVNINLSPDEFLLCYFLGAGELCIAFLSFFARKLRDKSSLRLISATFIVFHFSTGVLEVFALGKNGINSTLILNVLLRILISILFWYFGIYRNKK